MEFVTPSVYILSRLTAPESTNEVMRALGMTPLHTVFVHDLLDLPLALCFLLPHEVLKTHSEKDSIILAQEIFQETDMPCLVIGDAALLDCLYVDGRRESVNV